MRDIIWTIIILWIIFRIINVIKNTAIKKAPINPINFGQSSDRNNQPQRDLKTAIQKHLNNEGDYVDFEEIK